MISFTVIPFLFGQFDLFRKGRPPPVQLQQSAHGGADEGKDPQNKGGKALCDEILCAKLDLHNFTAPEKSLSRDLTLYIAARNDYPCPNHGVEQGET